MNVYFVSVGKRPFAKNVPASFKRYLPSARVIQMTDYLSDEIQGADEVMRTEFINGMTYFMIHCFSKITDEVFITTGDDCIINAPFDEIIPGDYDLCICKRTKPRVDKSGNDLAALFPYTNGLVIVKNPFFYKDCLNWLKVHTKYWKWFGDMAAIREVINSGKYIVKELPEDRFCRIPNRIGQGDDSAVLWHYAGAIRKEWMDYHGHGDGVGAL